MKTTWLSHRSSAVFRVAAILAVTLLTCPLLAQDGCGVEDVDNQDGQTLAMATVSPTPCQSPTPVPAGTPYLPDTAWSTGPKKLVCIRVTLLDKPLRSTVTSDQNALDTVGAKYRVYSRGRTDITSTVIPSGTPFPILRDSNYYLGLGSNCEGRKALHADAVQAAKDAGFTNVQTYYNRIMVHHPQFSISNGNSWADVKGKRIWMNGTMKWRLAAHEIGHSYGCRHAHLWNVTRIGADIEYGDSFDIMGSDYNSADINSIDFNEQYKHHLGWIPDRVNTLTSGKYYNLKIYRSDDPNTLKSSTKGGDFALKFSKDATYDYWIGYRANNFTNAKQGAHVKWAKKTNPESNLIDWVPSTNDPNTGGHLDAPVPIGSTLQDGGILITAKSVGQDTDGTFDKWIRVDVTVP